MIVKKIITTVNSLFPFKRRHSYLVLILLSAFNLFFCRKIQAGLDTLSSGARALGMGGAYVALANTADALFLNPGGLGLITGIEASLFYQKPFGLQDINFGTISLSFPMNDFHIGLGLVKLGNKVYNEQSVVLGLSHHVEHKIYYGLALRYQSLQITGYGSSGKPGLDLGFIVPVTNKFNLGFFSNNINRPEIGDSNERLPQIFKTGISIHPNPKLILSTEIYKDVRFPQELRFGMEFTPIENLSFRSGVANNPSRFSAGFGLNVRLFTLDYAFFTHNDLGLTHQFSLSIRFKHENISSATPKVIAEGDRPQNTELSDSQLQLDINKATVQELISLPGIGKTLARRIVDFRMKNGPFSEIKDLLAVKGIGTKTFEKIKDHLYVK